MFITNGGIADLLTVLAVTDPAKKARGGITAFVVEKGTPGFSVGKAEKKMGLRGSLTNELIFEDCRVPAGQIIGGQARLGQGFSTAMRVLDKGRLTLAASAVGMARKALELAVNYAKTRVQFGKPIGSFQLIQGMLAQMASELFAGQNMVYRTAWQKDQGQSVIKEAAMCKLFCTEMLGRVCDASLQVHGGMGYMKGVPDRAHLSRRPGDPHIRGHQRNPEDRHRKRAAQGLSGRRRSKPRRGPAAIRLPAPGHVMAAVGCHDQSSCHHAVIKLCAGLGLIPRVALPGHDLAQSPLGHELLIIVIPPIADDFLARFLGL